MMHARRRVGFWLPALLLAACSHAGPGTPVDDGLEQNLASGRQAMQLGAPHQAVRTFESAYRRALARDDAAAIDDSGYDLAAARLADDDAPGALAAVARSRQDLALRGSGGFGGLDLVQAAALHRLHREPEAAAAAERAEAAADASVRARAAFLAGVIADARGDLPVLLDARLRLDAGKAMPPDRQADLAEIDARIARRQARPRDAAGDALRAADLRRTLLDYRGMETDLRLAADACRATGEYATALALEQRADQSRSARHPSDGVPAPRS